MRPDLGLSRFQLFLLTMAFRREKATQKEPPAAPLMWAHSPLLVDRSSLNGQPLHWEPNHHKGSKHFPVGERTPLQAPDALSAHFGCFICWSKGC